MSGGEGCLSLVIPLVGYSWPRWHHKESPNADCPEEKTLSPSYLNERVPSSVNIKSEVHSFLGSNLANTLLKETYNPQLKLGSHFQEQEGKGSCLWMWSVEGEYFALVRLFPTGGGVLTLHKLLKSVKYGDVSSEVRTFSDSRNDAVVARADLRTKVLDPLVLKINEQLKGLDAKSSKTAIRVQSIGTPSHFPVYAITTLSGVGSFRDWTLPVKSEVDDDKADGAWSMSRLAQLAGRVLHNGDSVNILNIPRLTRHLSDTPVPETLNFSLDRRVMLMVGRRGAAIVAETFGAKNGDFPDYIAGSLVNLIEIMWNRLFVLVWLNAELDKSVARLDVEPLKIQDIQESLYAVRRSLFLLLKDPGCYLFDGGSVTDVADFLLERFWIGRQEELLKGKIALLDDLLASWQVLRAARLRDKDKEEK